MSFGLDVDCDPVPPVFKPRCCSKLHKSASLNLSAKRPSRTRLRFSIFTSELSFFASCFILSRLSRKSTILAMTGSFPGLPLFFLGRLVAPPASGWQHASRPWDLVVRGLLRLSVRVVLGSRFLVLQWFLTVAGAARPPCRPHPHCTRPWRRWASRRCASTC